MRRPDGNAHRPGRGAAGGALVVGLALLVSGAVAGGAASVARAEVDDPGGGTVVYERPEPGPRRGLLSVPAPVVYGCATLALVGGALYLVARARRRP